MKDREYYRKRINLITKCQFFGGLFLIATGSLSLGIALANIYLTSGDTATWGNVITDILVIIIGGMIVYLTKNEIVPKQVEPIDVLTPVQPDDTRKKNEMLLELGKLIRSVGRKKSKKHGNFWFFDVGDCYFQHDDYNNSVILLTADPDYKTTVKYFGIDWGEFKTKVEVEDFENAFQILKGFIKLKEETIQTELKI